MVKTLRRPGNKATGQCKAIAAKTCPFKHGHLHAQLVVIFNRFSYRATDNLPHHLSGSMSQFGQTRKSGNAIKISDLPLKADITRISREVRKVPWTEVPGHSIILPRAVIAPLMA
jgi:hypothetical protein